MMDQGTRAWMLKTASSSYWRISYWYGLDSLIQDGEMCWAIMKRRYPEAISPPLRMALFKRIFLNHIHDLANERTATVEIPFAMFDDATLEVLLNKEPCGFADLLQTVTESPCIVKQTLVDLMDNPSPLRDAYQFTGKLRETLNQRLCSIVGLDADEYDLHSAMRAAFG